MSTSNTTLKRTVVKVDSKRAEALLKKNTRNRKIKPLKVTEFADMMVAGKWSTAADTPIKVALDGTLLDGQHRLQAIVESDVSLEMEIWTNCPPESQEFMDRGTARTLSNDLQIHGYKNTSLVASVVSAIDVYITTGGLTKIKNCSFARAEELMDLYPDIIGCVDAAKSMNDKTRKLGIDPCLTGTQAALVLFLTSHTVYGPTKAMEFIQGIFTPGIASGDPRMAFRKIITASKSSKNALKERYTYEYAFIAWNKFVAGEKTQVLKIPKVVRIKGASLGKPVQHTLTLTDSVLEEVGTEVV